MKQTIYTIQYLRGLAALLVVSQHAVFKYSQYNPSNTIGYNLGGFGVDLFFVISGFVMCYSTQFSKMSPAKFFSHRIIRIFPLYITLTLLAFAIYLVKPELVNSSGGKTDLLASFTLLPTKDKLLVQNGWTLSYEFFFYIIFSISIFISYKLRGIISIVLLSSLCLLSFYKPQSEFIFNFITSPLLFEFVLGIVIYLTYKHIKILQKTTALILIMLSIILIAIQSNTGIFETVFDRALYAGLPMAMLLLGFILLENELRLAPTSLKSSLYFLGDISYSLYLSHAFVLSPASMILSRITTNSFFFITSIVCIALVAGTACYLLLEKPLTRYFKGLMSTNTSTIKTTSQER
ncbi:TPA: acyltransferase family protein [Klebsiella aerogenes]